MVIYNHEIDIECDENVFGDGQHETTRFLLYYLNRYANGKTVIDAGCGSGILSVFAYKCGATVTAIDCESSAIQCCKHNIKQNDADIELLNTDIACVGIVADIVVANFAQYDILNLFQHIVKMSKELIITTWYKDIPLDIIGNMKVIDYIEGIEYDCYVLKRR